MEVAEVPLYFQAVQRLKRRYSDRISIKAGLEIEFHPRHTGLFKQIVDDFAFDVIGSSIHQIDGIDIVSGRSASSNSFPDPEALQSRYLETLELMVTHDYFDIICHLDLPKKFGDRLRPHFTDRLADILYQAAERNLAVEVNTSGFDHPTAEAYPAPHVLTAVKEVGMAVTIGSDAHRPEEIGRHFERAFNMLQAARMRTLAVFTGRRRSEAPIPSVPLSLQ